MAKQKVNAPVDTGSEIVEELHVTAEEGVEFTDVTGKDDLPEGVVDPKDEELEDEKPEPKKAAKAKTKPAEGDDLPEELKGKTPAQLAKMYRDAQSVIGRQGTELGDLRRTADTYIRARLQADAKAATPKPDLKDDKPLDDVDFFTNPKAAIEKAIANHPSLKGLKDVAQQYGEREVFRQRQENANQFNAKHPDAAEVMGDENFRGWVEKSAVRKALLLRAHKNFDFMAGDEIFSTWKELQAARVPAKEGDAKSAIKSAKIVAGKEAARVPTGGNATPRGTTDKSQKIYRRADIIRLMEQDPNRYELMGTEITKAYQEGRVR